MADEKPEPIVLPVVRIERGDLDLARQRIHPSADRRNVVDLDRFKQQQNVQAHLRQALKGPRR